MEMLGSTAIQEKFTFTTTVSGLRLALLQLVPLARKEMLDLLVRKV
jgi:hypothetical protein